MACFLAAAAQLTRVAFEDVDKALLLSMPATGDCNLRRASILLDKPVYRNGETVHLTLYNYHFFSKRPLSQCAKLATSVVSLSDAQGRLVGYFDNLSEQLQPPAPADAAAQYFTFKVPEDLVGGSYYASLVEPTGDRAQFFVLGFTPKSHALVADWNLEAVKPGDSLLGKLTLKSFVRAAPPPTLLVSYTFRSGAATLQTAKTVMAAGQLTIRFTVPAGAGPVVFSAAATIDQLPVEYNREFPAASLSSLAVSFFHGSGKPVVGATNTVVFQARQSVDSRLEAALADASLVRVAGGASFPLPGAVATEAGGLGAFQLPVSSADVAAGSAFFLQLGSGGAARRLLVLNTTAADFSPVHMRPNKQVFKPTEAVLLTISAPAFRGDVLLVLQDKSKVLFKKKLVLDGPLRTESLGLAGLIPEAGGVFTVQLYTRRLSPVPLANNSTLYYDGQAQQEFEVLVEPRAFLAPKVAVSGSARPGATLQYSVTLDGACAGCAVPASTFLLVDVVDQSAFVETDRADGAASLPTKTLLEKEVFSPTINLRSSAQYIDHLFAAGSRTEAARAATKRKIELLLGAQAARRFHFDPSQLQDFVLAPTAAKFAERRVFLSALTPHSGRRFAPLNARRVGATPRDLRPPVATNSTAPSDQQVVLDVVRHDNVLHRKFEPMAQARAAGSFALPHYVSQFSLRVWVVSDLGLFGSDSLAISVAQDFNIAADLPLYIYDDEVFTVPLSLRNNLARPAALSLRARDVRPVTIPADSAVGFDFPVSAKTVPAVVTLEAADGTVVAALRVAPAVVPSATRVSVGTAQLLAPGAAASLDYEVQLPDALVAGSGCLNVCAQTTLLDLIVKLIARFNKLPIGCFEQVSVFTFPLIELVRLLLLLTTLSSQLALLLCQMLTHLRKGFARLVPFECPVTSGFEWFGRSPCHVTLTAFGLWQHLQADTLRLDPPLVDPDVVPRLVDFLASSRNPFGGFKLGSDAHQLGHPEQAVSDAYITSVLSRRFAQYKDRFAGEVAFAARSFQTYWESKAGLDAYQLALVGLVLQNSGDFAAAGLAARDLAARQDAASGRIAGAASSITRSAGVSLDAETAALAAMFLAQADFAQFRAPVEAALGFALASLQHGLATSTQSAILSVMALAQYTAAARGDPAGATAFSVSLQKFPIAQIVSSFQGVQAQCVDLSADLAALEAAGRRVSVAVRSEALAPASRPLVLTVDSAFLTTAPLSAANSPLSLTVVRQVAGSVYAYAITIKNLQNATQGMLVYEFNKASALDFSIGDLESLKLRNLISHYELRNDNSQVALYLRGMSPNSTVRFSLPLYWRFKANNVVERVHSLYLYYAKELSIVYMTPS